MNPLPADGTTVGPQIIPTVLNSGLGSTLPSIRLVGPNGRLAADDFVVTRLTTGGFSRFVTFEPKTALAPGQYQMSFKSEADPNFPSSFPGQTETASVTFTVAAGAMPDAPKPITGIRWFKTTFETPVLNSCGPFSQTNEIELAADPNHGADPMVWYEVSLTGAQPRTTPIFPSWLPDKTTVFASQNSNSDVACVVVIAKDLYGQSSAPFQLCEPQKCATRSAQPGSGAPNWDSIDGCEPGAMMSPDPEITSGCTCVSPRGGELGSFGMLGLVLIGLRRRPGSST